MCDLALLAIVIDSVVGQKKPSCYKYWLEDAETIDQVYFPYEGKCQFFWQCTAHGGDFKNYSRKFHVINLIFAAMRMKCSYGMSFDTETNQCGRSADVNC